MSVAMFIYAFLLFFVLTPGVIVSLPPKGSKMMVAGVHALVFALIWILTSKYVWMATSGLFEGYSDNKSLSFGSFSKVSSNVECNSSWLC